MLTEELIKETADLAAAIAAGRATRLDAAEFAHAGTGAWLEFERSRAAIGQTGIDSELNKRFAVAAANLASALGQPLPVEGIVLRTLLPIIIKLLLENLDKLK